jgi:hypothetical protein
VLVMVWARVFWMSNRVSVLSVNLTLIVSLPM